MQSDNVVFVTFIRTLTLLFVFLAFLMFSGPLGITVKSMELVRSLNALRATLPPDVVDENERKIDRILSYMDRLNAGSGPGFMFLGASLSPAIVWDMFATVMSAIVGVSVSTI